MSQSKAGPSRRRQQYVARACNSCRRRRCKCDGIPPVCGPCSTTGHECTWGVENEESGRPATKQFVESLRVKIQQLESEISQLKQERHQTESPFSTPSHPPGSLPDPSPGPTESTWSPITQTTAFGITNHPQLSPQSSNIIESPHPIQPTQLIPIENPIVNLPPIVPSLRYQYIFNIDATLPLDEQYPSHRASIICQWNRYLPDLSPVYLSRLEHDSILFRCFSYGASCSFGLLPDLFLADLLECLTPTSTTCHPSAGTRYYTPILHCSLMAFAAAYSDDPEIRAMETREKFATHAKGWLDREFVHPSPSLMLSLVLLSEYHSGIGERNIGHMYMGMAVRAARFRTSSPDALVQDWQRWSTFVQECLMALEIHKPTELPAPRVPISCPIAMEPDSRPPLTESVIDLLTHGDYFKYSTRSFIQMCKLMMIATRMIDHPLNDQQTTLNIHLQLETWFNHLPESVLIRQRSALTFPPVLALHITYWWLILRSHLSLAEQINSSTSEPVRDLSIKMCARATEKLVQLFSSFDKQFGLRYFPRNLIKAIYACGSALVVERDSAPVASRKKRAMANEGIGVCINALKTVGDVWPVGIRMNEELEALAAVDPE